MAMTMVHDALGRPYLYIANKEAGLKVYNISNPVSPRFVATVSTAEFDSLDVMNLFQSGHYLYLAIGNHFTNPEPGGMAVIDVSDPESPGVKDFFVVPAAGSGAGSVRVQGDIAYLGAMQSGLVLLDVSEKINIRFISQYLPDIDFPAPKPNANLYNARGLEVKGDLVYLCYDAGGLRIINCKNKLSPVETGRYANPALYKPFNLPRAYNNLILDSPYVYVAVDYCGMEVLNITDTAHIKLEGWWNPYNCPANNWFTSPVHANEIQYDKTNKLLFLSTGRSDAAALDVSIPSTPQFCKQYGENSDAMATWGIGLYQNEIYLSYICTLGIPFFSNWTGIQIIHYTPVITPTAETGDDTGVKIYPNPARDLLIVEWPKNGDFIKELLLYNGLGQKVYSKKTAGTDHFVRLDISSLVPGIYFLRFDPSNGSTYSKKLVIHY